LLCLQGLRKGRLDPLLMGQQDLGEGVHEQSDLLCKSDRNQWPRSYPKDSWVNIIWVKSHQEPINITFGGPVTPLCRLFYTDSTVHAYNGAFRVSSTAEGSVIVYKLCLMYLLPVHKRNCV
jgi:hypothetical protein